MLYVKKASVGELGMIMDIYSAARESMVRTGNPTQWGSFYPSEELVANDIRQGTCYVIHDKNQLHGVFALCTGEEPTYREIYDGAWLNDQPYVTMHRIAADGKAHGIFRTAADFAKHQADNVRIDTHENNLIMQRLIKKHGFVRCGTIYVDDGSPRLAYQWTNTFPETQESNDKDLTWQEVKTEHIIQDEWIDFRRSAYRYPDGRVFEPFYSYSRRDYTVIVASDEEGNYLCVRQFRQGIREVTTEFPAGGIERTDGQEYGSKTSAESALDCAKRELMEETGYVSDEWEHLITIPSNATVSDNYAYVFMAKNCRKDGDQSLDETECLNVEKHTAAEIETMIHTGKFQQSVHVMAWLLAKEDV